MINKSSVYIYISVSIAVILWGFSFVWTNILLLKGLPVLTLILLRMCLAALILLSVSLTFKKLEKVSLKDWPKFLLLVLMEPFVYFIGETYGLQIVNSATIGSVIISTIPIFALAAGILFFKENISVLNIFGMSITIPGILLVVFEKGEMNFSHTLGILLLFMAVFSAVGYSVIVKKLANKYNSYTIVTYQHLLGFFYFLPLFFIFDSSSFSFKEFATPEIFLLLFALAASCSCLAFVLYINSIKVLGVAKSSIFTALIPAVSAAGAYMLGQEGMNIRKLSGIVIVVAGVIIAQRKKRASSSLKAESSLS